MNPEQIMNQLESLISRRKITGSGKYYICIQKDALAVVPTTIIPTPEFIFTTCNDYILIQGFTQRQWLSLAEKINKYFIAKENQ